MTPNTVLVDAIAASKTNPRKHFDKAALQELAESIARHGVLQPILVRPNGSDGTYELVAGERRWRAAKIAQLERIPATVRELTDAEVLEIQVVENLQRADLHPLEEAEGYEALMKCQHADGHAYTADEIAAKVGKSRSYIYQRLKLTALTPSAREAFYAGRLDASKALLVARVPEALQGEVLDRLAPRDEEDWTPSFREAREIIHDEFMLDLKKPPFDVRAIYFARDQANPIGTPCGECPKRTGNQPQLFDDVKSGDICTDPACFKAKTAAHVEKLAEEHRAKGHTVLTGDAAHKVMPHSWGQPRGGFLRLDEPHPLDPKRQPLAKRLGKKAPLATLVEHPNEEGVFVHLVAAKAAQEALVAAGHEWAQQKPASKAQSPATPTGSSRTHDATREAVELAIHKELREAVREKGLDEQALRTIVEILRDELRVDEGIEALAPDSPPASVPASELQPLLIDHALGDLVWGTAIELRRDLAAHYGIDVEAVEKRVQAERKAQAEAEAAKKPAKATKKGKAAPEPAEASA